VSAEQVIQSTGLVLPAAATPPPGFTLPFEFARVSGNRVFLAGHMPQAPDGSPCGPFGPVPSTVPLPAAQQAARLAGLSMLASLRRAVGDLDRVSAWLMIQGFVNADPQYAQTTLVLNGCSELILEVFGPHVGSHARTAIGVAALPLNSCVIVAAELELHPG
jgi:enamine deaminase RidA (YjgF/YER057c/UK114 family)